MRLQYNPGSFSLGALDLPDEDNLIEGAGIEQTILTAESITQNFSSGDRRLEIRNCTLLFPWAGTKLIKVTAPQTSSNQRSMFQAQNVEFGDCFIELGNLWFPKFIDVIIRGGGIRSAQEVLMGLLLQNTHIFPPSEETGVKITGLAEGFVSENSSVEGSLDGFVIELSEPRPCGTFRGGHTATKRFGIRTVNCAQGFIENFLGYRIGNVAHNSINAEGGGDVTVSNSKFVNLQEGSNKADASAVVIGAGHNYSKVIGCHANSFGKAYWIQGGASKTQGRGNSAYNCDTALVNSGTGTDFETVLV